MDYPSIDSDMHMDEDSPIGGEPNHNMVPSGVVVESSTPSGSQDPFQTMYTIQVPSLNTETATETPPQQYIHSQTQTGLRNLAVKVHVRKPGRVAWKYVGRANVLQEFQGSASRVVIRSVSSGKVIISFSETSEVQADKRGNFIVVACVEPQGVTSWSLNTVNNSDSLKLLASIELACYRCKQAILDPSRYTKSRRRIEKVVREDRRRRHNNKKEEDELAAAFGSQQIAGVHNDPMPTPASNPFLAGIKSSPPVSTNFLNSFNPAATATVAQ